MPEHSAEFLRGVVFGMHAAGIDCIAREELVHQYRARLAEAEAREAAPDAAAVIAQCKATLEKAQGYVSAFESLHKSVWGNNAMCKSAKDHLTEAEDGIRDSLAAIAAWESGR